MTDVPLHGPQVLYRNWEHEQWNPWSIDLTLDLSTGLVLAGAFL